MSLDRPPVPQDTIRLSGCCGPDTNIDASRPIIPPNYALSLKTKQELSAMTSAQMEARIQELTIQNSALLEKQKLYSGNSTPQSGGAAMTGQHEQELANLRRDLASAIVSRDDAIESRDAAIGALEAEKESHALTSKALNLMGDPANDAVIAKGKVVEMEKRNNQLVQEYAKLEKKNIELEAQLTEWKSKIEAISNRAHEKRPVLINPQPIQIPIINEDAAQM